VNAREEAGFPEVRSGSRSIAGEEDDVGGEVLRLAPETIGRPRSNRGIALAVQSGVEDELGGAVVELGRVHRLHKTKLIGDGAELREQFGEGESALAVFVEMIG
jgi:hypothetical protein